MMVVGVAAVVIYFMYFYSGIIIMTSGTLYMTLIMTIISYCQPIC